MTEDTRTVDDHPALDADEARALLPHRACECCAPGGLEERVVILAASLQGADREVGRLRAELATTCAELATTRAELATTRAELAGLRAECAELRAVVAGHEQRLRHQGRVPPPIRGRRPQGV